MSFPCTSSGCKCASFTQHKWMPGKCMDCQHSRADHQVPADQPAEPAPIPIIRSATSGGLNQIRDAQNAAAPCSVTNNTASALSASVPVFNTANNNAKFAAPLPRKPIAVVQAQPLKTQHGFDQSPKPIAPILSTATIDAFSSGRPSARRAPPPLPNSSAPAASPNVYSLSVVSDAAAQGPDSFASPANSSTSSNPEDKLFARSSPMTSSFYAQPQALQPLAMNRATSDDPDPRGSASVPPPDSVSHQHSRRNSDVGSSHQPPQPQALSPTGATSPTHANQKGFAVPPPPPPRPGSVVSVSSDQGVGPSAGDLAVSSKAVPALSRVGSFGQSGGIMKAIADFVSPRQLAHLENITASVAKANQQSRQGPAPPNRPIPPPPPPRPHSDSRQNRAQTYGDALQQNVLDRERNSLSSKGAGYRRPSRDIFSLLPQREESERNMKEAREYIERQSIAIRAVQDSTATTFRNKLFHKYPTVVSQIKAGIATLKRVRGFFKKYCQLHREFSDALHNIVISEKHKLQSMPDPDKMPSAAACWTGVMEEMEKMATIYQELATEATLTIFYPLDTFHAIANKRLKELQHDYERTTSTMRTATSGLDRKRANCISLLEKLDKKQKDAKRDANGQILEASSKSIEKLRAKAFQACEEYDFSQRAASQKREAYWTRELPHILEEMQVVEEIRLNTVKRLMVAFTELQQRIDVACNAVTAQITKYSNAMTPQEDISHYVKTCMELHGEPPEWKPYVYDLPTPLDDLRPGGKVLPNLAIFRTTFQAIMDLQQKFEPLADYGGVPRILYTLTNAIIRLGGLRSEGLFRVSPAQNELLLMRDQFAQGDYDIKTDNPHLPAALLKFWLRDMLEPVIPFAFYQDCINIGKLILEKPEDKAAGEAKASPPPVPSRMTAGIAPGLVAGPGGLRPIAPMGVISPLPVPIASQTITAPELVQKIEAVLSQVPAINRRVLHYLVTLIRDVASFQEYNRMTISNLAIVFAPSILRDPTDDPQVMFRDSKHAAQFVTFLGQLESLSILGDQPALPARRGSISVSGIPIISLAEAQQRARARSRTVAEHGGGDDSEGFIPGSTPAIPLDPSVTASPPLGPAPIASPTAASSHLPKQAFGIPVISLAEAQKRAGMQPREPTFSHVPMHVTVTQPSGASATSPVRSPNALRRQNSGSLYDGEHPDDEDEEDEYHHISDPYAYADLESPRRNLPTKQQRGAHVHFQAAADHAETKYSSSVPTSSTHLSGEHDHLGSIHETDENNRGGYEEADEGPLPPGWEEYVDDASGSVYYVKTATQESTWFRPTE